MKLVRTWAEAVMCCVCHCHCCFAQAFQWIRDFTDRPMTTRQAVLANVAKNVVDTDAGRWEGHRLQVRVAAATVSSAASVDVAGTFTGHAHIGAKAGLVHVNSCLVSLHLMLLLLLLMASAVVQVLCC